MCVVWVSGRKLKNLKKGEFQGKQDIQKNENNRKERNLKKNGINLKNEKKFFNWKNSEWDEKIARNKKIC